MLRCPQIQSRPTSCSLFFPAAHVATPAQKRIESPGHTPSSSQDVQQPLASYDAAADSGPLTRTWPRKARCSCIPTLPAAALCIATALQTAQLLPARQPCCTVSARPGCEQSLVRGAPLPSGLRRAPRLPCCHSGNDARRRASTVLRYATRFAQTARQLHERQRCSRTHGAARACVLSVPQQADRRALQPVPRPSCCTCVALV